MRVFWITFPLLLAGLFGFSFTLLMVFIPQGKTVKSPTDFDGSNTSTKGWLKTGAMPISQNMTRIPSVASVLARHTYYYIVTTVSPCPCRSFSSNKITALGCRPFSTPTNRTLPRERSREPWYCTRQTPSGQSMAC